MSTPPRAEPERLATTARSLRKELGVRVTLYADALAQSLADDLGLVAWDREQLIGGLQQRLRSAVIPQIRRGTGETPLAGCRVLERRTQPLESIDLAWQKLCEGLRVHIEHEPGACQAALELMRGMARLINDRMGIVVLSVADDPWTSPPLDPSASASAFRLAVGLDDPSLWRVVGPARPGPRVAIVESEADRELAAYVLARSSLRRTGLDPRAVKHAYVVGPLDLLRRHMVRLWLSAIMGPATSPGAFAGPVSPAVRDDYLAAHEAWSSYPEVETWCAGGELERDGAPVYLAPALFCTPWPAPELPTSGPMLVVVKCDLRQAQTAAELAAREHGQIIAIAAGLTPYAGQVTAIRGALLVERLPPGLPEPRPV